MHPKGLEQPHPGDLSLELALVVTHSFPQCTFPVLDVSNIAFALRLKLYPQHDELPSQGASCRDMILLHNACPSLNGLS